MINIVQKLLAFFVRIGENKDCSEARFLRTLISYPAYSK